MTLYPPKLLWEIISYKNPNLCKHTSALCHCPTLFPSPGGPGFLNSWALWSLPAKHSKSVFYFDFLLWAQLGEQPEKVSACNCQQGSLPNLSLNRNKPKLAERWGVQPCNFITAWSSQEIYKTANSRCKLKSPKRKRQHRRDWTPTRYQWFKNKWT